MKNEPKTPNSNRGFDAQNLCTCPYYRPLRLSGLTASVDSVRMKYSYSRKSYDHERSESMDTMDQLLRDLTSIPLFMEHLFDIQHMQSNFRIGNYAHTIVYDLPDGNSFAVMIGRYSYDSGDKQMACEAVLDFNPNKVNSAAFKRIMGILAARATSVTVHRFDLAIDFPILRDTVQLVQRPGSTYSKYVGADGAVTEYNGNRSQHSAVKLYDKAKELGMETPMTRLEITISREKFKTVHQLIPDIQSCAPLELSLCLDDLPFEVQAVIIHPDLYDRLKASTSRNTWAKYKKLIQGYGGTMFTIPDDQLDQIDKYVRDYIATLPNAHMSDPDTQS